MKNFSGFATAFAIVCVLASVSETKAQFVATVPVGYPGNTADPETGLGAVDYPYRMGTYEVTNSQYVEFLNSVAATDTYALYNTKMTTVDRGGIIRSGESGQYTYTSKDNFGDKPVNWVSFYDVARFVNWLQNGRPSGAESAGATETGAYDLESDGTLRRSPGAIWFIPTVDEWYKAAYYQPSALGGDDDDYWLFATASNDSPVVATATAAGDISNPGANVVTYSGGASWGGIGSGRITTVGSAGELSKSFFGTYDQSGNLVEWTEVDATTGLGGGYGGALVSSVVALYAGAHFGDLAPDVDANAGGFRVARIAKPAMAGDFNEDYVLDVADMDLLTWHSARNGSDPFFDLTGDDLVNIDDVHRWAKDLKHTWIGDANLDGEFNSSDLIAVFQSAKYERDEDASWAEGDWTGDGRVDTGDLTAAFGDGGYEFGPRAAVRAVPEPSGAMLLAIGVIGMHRFRKLLSPNPSPSQS